MHFGAACLWGEVGTHPLQFHPWELTLLHFPFRMGGYLEGS